MLIIYLKVQIICLKYVEEFVHRIDCARELCNWQSGHGTVTIGSIEKYVTETAWDKGWVKPIGVTEN